MQILDKHNIEKRILFYWSRLYLKQLKRGENYRKLNRSISIIFLDYEIEKLKELPIHTKWQIRNDKNGKTLLTEDLEIHIIEIPKINKMLENGKYYAVFKFLMLRQTTIYLHIIGFNSIIQNEEEKYVRKSVF